jgi:hypothetical protein
MAAFVRGLLAGLPRVNCWTIAEHAGERCPRGMQRLLSEAVWDDAGMRDDLRGYVLEHFADPAAVLVVDETGDLKKGTATVGVQRQYTGAAGRTENAQVAVYLAYAAPAGSAFIDRALYLPRSWTSDPARCRSAGVPQDTVFATKPVLAQGMITRALDAGTPAGWVAVYGQDPQLRAELVPAAAWATSWPSGKATRSSRRPGRSRRASWPGGCPPGPWGRPLRLRRGRGAGRGAEPIAALTSLDSPGCTLAGAGVPVSRSTMAQSDTDHTVRRGVRRLVSPAGCHAYRKPPCAVACQVGGRIV